MKLKLTITALVAAMGLSAFGQGFVTFTANTSVYDALAGVRGTSGEYDVAFLWNQSTNQALDTLTSSGANFSARGQAPNKQSATNGTYNTGVQLASLQTLVAAGWQFASNGTSLMSVANANQGTVNFQAGAQVGVNNSVAGSTIQIIMVAWNASAGLTAILNGAGITAFGYSNPFLDLTGTSATDPNALTVFNSEGMNQFGVAPATVPEPTTLALAGLGAAMLIFRKRKE